MAASGSETDAASAAAAMNCFGDNVDSSRPLGRGLKGTTREYAPEPLDVVKATLNLADIPGRELLRRGESFRDGRFRRLAARLPDDLLLRIDQDERWETR